MAGRPIASGDQPADVGSPLRNDDTSVFAKVSKAISTLGYLLPHEKHARTYTTSRARARMQYLVGYPSEQKSERTRVMVVCILNELVIWRSHSATGRREYPEMMLLS